MVRFILLFLFCFSAVAGIGQTITVEGHVYDHFTKRPVEAVSVIGTNHHFTVTDSSGFYSIALQPGEYLYFSYLNKKTLRHLVDTISFLSDFDVALYIDGAWLPGVTVRSRNYRLDSIQNRKDYEKVFGLKRGVSTSVLPPSQYVPGAVTAGLDLESVINAFRPKKMRQLYALQDRLLAQERENYVKSRFTRRLVIQVTPLKAGTAELDSFMMNYAPSYDLLVPMNELELGYYVQECYKQFAAMRRRRR